jgi:hypothetical protein
VFFSVFTFVAFALKLKAAPLPFPVFVLLTIVFITSGSALVSYVAALAYVRRGSQSMLLLCSGSLVFGSTSLVAAVAALMAGLQGSNAGTTIFLGGALVSAFFHVSCVATRSAGRKGGGGSPLAAVLTVVGVIALSLALILGAFFRAFPPLLVPGSGLTQMGTGVGAAAIVGYGAGVLLIASASGSAVLSRYFSALALTAVGLVGLLIADWTFTDVVFSVGRLSFCAAGAYMFLSVSSAAKPVRATFDSVIEELFES